VFPGGGVDEGESLEQAAIREAREELGIEVAIRQRVAEIQLGQKSRQIYYLVEQIGGEFGTGMGEEFAESAPDDPESGVYIPIWMDIDELPQHTDVHPADMAALVVSSAKEGWSSNPILSFEVPK
jgi:8-oxo-dGTP pyrophosphatase MutT (NUDIX family)